MTTFRIRLLPAAHGDCILVEYGPAAPFHRFLIDGGTPSTWKQLQPVLAALLPEERKLELLVVTHVDADHIGGALKVLDPGVPQLEFGDIWFNGYRHLKAVEEFGPVQGEKLTTLLWPRMNLWNRAFGGKAVVVTDNGNLPQHTLPGGMKLTLLSPTRDKLLALLPVWAKACAEADIDPQVVPPAQPAPGLEPMGAIDFAELASRPFHEDEAEANGSSIAFLAEYGNRKVLFGADAHPTVLVNSIARLPGGQVELAALKLPHHGSKHNTNAALLAKAKTSRYLFSTNGAQFRHPDRETVARILASKKPCELYFNYQSQYTTVFDDDNLRTEWCYRTVFGNNTGLTIDL